MWHMRIRFTMPGKSVYSNLKDVRVAHFTLSAYVH